MTDPALLVRRTAAAPGAPRLDAAQQAVVDHPGGPLLVLAGPGTGKTTTLVEAVVARVAAGLAPERVLVLTFSRKAAQELRERITARLGGTTRGAMAMTFHSYAYALLRRELHGAPPRLLSGPEQDLEVSRLLAGQVEDGAATWGEDLRPALELRGFRRELRDLLGRAQERGVDAVTLRALGEQAGRPEWVSAAAFLADYEARFDLDPRGPAVDQSALVGVAVGLLESDDDLRARERADHAVVFVDEVQDTDPAQLRLLRALAGDGRDLIAVGDPDQSIYAFRGAEVRGVLEFPGVFRTADGDPAPQVVLRTSRRSGPVLLAASRALAARLPSGALVSDFRALVADPAVVPGPGRVELRLASSTSAEAAVVADVLRRAHLHDGVAWSDMAVLVRSTLRSLAPLRRGLLAAGVPVAVPADEVPLVQHPLVRALLDLIALALTPDDKTPAVEQVLTLLTGPLVRADPLAVRRLRRALRALEAVTDDGTHEVREAALDEAPSPEPTAPVGGSRSSDEVLVEAVLDPRSALLLGGEERRPLDRAHRLLAAVRQAAGAGRSVEDVLWAAWQASRLEERLTRDSTAGGPRGAVADAALDAVIALFDAAARHVDRLPLAGARAFALDLQAQEIPGDTLSARTPEGDAVRVMTAHASKGLEWRVVVVAGVQEGVWPDLRLRGSLLGADDLAAFAQGRGSAETPAAERRVALLAEERRLFYVAVTRARERLVVTAVNGGEADGERPSRLLSELGLEVPETVAPVGRPLTAAGLVAELRHVAATHQDPVLREAACRRLASLAQDLAPAAHPDRWWGTAELSDAGPLVRADEQVRVSPSKVESFELCSLRWLLQSAVGISSEPGPAQVIGTLVHALAELAAGPDALDEAALARRLDEALPQLDLGAPWAVVRRREEALAALRRFLAWQQANPRELVGTEIALSVPFGDRAVLTGRVDRLERDDQDRAFVVDLKTGSSKPTRDELPRNPQLGVYQLAVALGAFADDKLTESGGASLLQLKKGRVADDQRQVALADDEDPDWAHDLVTRVVEGMSGAEFGATVNKHCGTCDVRRCCPAWPEGTGVVR